MHPPYSHAHVLVLYQIITMLALAHVAPTAIQLPSFAFGGAKAPAPPPAFCYGLPGNVGPAGDFDPAGFLEGKSELEVKRYREVKASR